MRSATQLARLWFEVAGGLTEIVRDVDLSVEEAAGRNLILFGGPEDNFFTSKVLATPDSSAEKADKSSKHPSRADGAAGELPLAFQQQSLILGPCAFDRRQHGLLSLLPWQSHRLALLLVPPRGANASSDVASGILRMPQEVPGVPGRPSAAQAAIRSWQAVFRLFLAGLFIRLQAQRLEPSVTRLCGPVVGGATSAIHDLAQRRLGAALAWPRGYCCRGIL